MFLARRLLKRQLLKAYPKTNKDAGRNALLATDPRAQPSQHASSGGYAASAWRDAGGPQRPASRGTAPVSAPSPRWLARGVVEGYERAPLPLAGSCGLQVPRFGEGAAWINPRRASPWPWLPSRPPARRPPRAGGSPLCASRILPGRCQSPECGQRPC